jgi:peroxiredoxin
MMMNDIAPDFQLPDLDGRLHTLGDHRGRIVVLTFWSCECRHTVRTDETLPALRARWGKDVVVLPIAANRIETREAIAAAARERGLPTVLLDPEHRVADLYDAQTTPHVFIIDRDGMLRYRGALDDTSFAQREPTRSYLEEAVDALLEGRMPRPSETQPYGCAIVREAVE